MSKENGINSMIREKYLLLGISFSMYFTLALNKLTQASLWFDEIAQYYDSVNVLKGYISIVNFPLYHLAVFTWLNIYDGEWWFRFFGVIMGFVGAAGLYKSVCTLIDYKAACISVLLYSTTYQIIYYVQECSPKNMMIALLGLTFYYFVVLLMEQDSKAISRFLVLSCLSVYCDFIAVYSIVGMYVIIFVKTVYTKQLIPILKYGMANRKKGIFAIVLLNLVIARIMNQIQWTGLVKADIFDGQFIHILWTDFIAVFQWIMSAGANKGNTEYIVLIALLILIFSIICLVKSKNSMVRYLFFLNLFIWFFYYFTVKLNLNGKSSFGNSDNLFFIILWIPYIVLIFYEFLNIILCAKKKLYVDRFRREVKYLFMGFCVVFLFSYCERGWTAIKDNWYKEDIRSSVSLWYDVKAYESNTLVYYASTNGFAYYVARNDNYNELFEEDIIYQPWQRDKSEEEYEGYFVNVYGERFPEKIYIVASHYRPDLKTMLEVLKKRGYKQEVLYDKDGGRLYCMYK